MKFTLALLCCLSVAACSDGPTSPDSVSPGVYQLTLYGGNPLPSTLASDSIFKLELVAASLTLAADHSYLNILTVRSTPTGGTAVDQFDSLPGTYVRSGTKITFSDPHGAVAMVGNLNANVLLMTGNPSMKYVRP